MKTPKAILVLGLVAALFVGCSKNTNSTNSTTTTTDNANTKMSTPAATPATAATMPSPTASAESNAEPRSTASGEGETFTNREAGVQFTLPAGWNTKREGETITATSEHDAVSVVFWVPPGNDFDKATDDLMQELDNTIKNPKITSPGQESTHNGMRAYTTGGTGEVNGQPILWEVDAVKAKKPFFVLTFAAPQMFKMHQSEYQQLLSTIKPVE